ncbi:hypothetical protein [Mesorhizobium sp. WSM3866]|uniref:hypothetical protein n=1 Tax=Mesorhizobium sp. WSM3866 TaxID=422271 RepID=UPI001140CF6F|nr:hypothetical protein [Mesorhizobium sp. WSM3866]
MDDVGYFLAVYNETLKLRAERQRILAVANTEQERAQRTRLEIRAIFEGQRATDDARSSNPSKQVT